MTAPTDNEIVDWLKEAADSAEHATLQAIDIDRGLKDEDKPHQRAVVRNMHNAAVGFLRKVGAKGK